jgi:hypothetical protein
VIEKKRQSAKAFLVAAEDQPLIWLALTDGRTKTYEVVALETEQVLAVGPGFIVFGINKDAVKAKTELMGYKSR